MASLLASLPFILAAVIRDASANEAYSTNPVCRQNNCVNPVFPGLLDMPNLEQLVWECSTEADVRPYLDFCKGAVHYDSALPSPKSKGQHINDLVRAQDDAALTMFFYHMSAMGYEVWDYTSPWNSSSQCVQSVWRLTCFTYFPKSQAGCKSGESTPYYRPCKDCCEHYLNSCQVECCDDSALCNFQHVVDGQTGSNGAQLVQTGYSSTSGPSAICTGKAPTAAAGGAQRYGSPTALLLLIFGLNAAWLGHSNDAESTKPPRKSSFLGSVALMVVMAIVAVALQGFDVGQTIDKVNLQVPHHSVANWRTKSNYLVSYQYIPSGGNSSAAVLNSCATFVANPCSGHGVCKQWKRKYSGSDPALAFCQCDPEWADPECRTLRKSQLKAFLLALFLGIVGADYFYLGFPIWGILKAVTCGGFGVLWLVDVVRTGAGPIYASDFRVSPDFPHFMFVLLIVVLFLIIGLVISINSYLTGRSRKRSELMQIQHKEECRSLGKLDEMTGPRFELANQQAGYEGSRSFSGYGATLPMPLPNAGAPRASTNLPAYGQDV